MSFLDKIEHGFDHHVNKALSRVFRSGTKPVDITSAIRRTMDSDAKAISSDRIIAPNVFVVKLSQTDSDSLGGALGVLSAEFAEDATRYAEQQGYALHGPIDVSFVVDDVEHTGQLQVESSNRQGSVAPATAVAPSPEHPIVDINGERWLLKEKVTVIGRGSDSDIRVDDSGVSRRHLELRITPTGVIATDLGSTNGLFVEENKVEAATLLDGNTLRIGRTEIRFWTHELTEPSTVDRDVL